MRKIDENKRKQIQEAVYDLTQSDGLVGLSMGKVAKLAGVSPATIYIYYNDKEDMLSRMYEQVKDLFDAGITAEIDAAPTLVDKIRAAEWHFIKKFRQFPKQAVFMNAILNNESLVDQKAKHYADEMAEPVSQLFSQTQKDPEFMKMDAVVATGFFSLPLQLAQDGATDAQLEQTIEMMIKVFKK
ncbi:TetR/AcrR family transcriptional regulator [Lapidilactobacillus bayanensis]|uniref:TetR/AcrR family transcriptional regulator n=1 Tax=Lapidilactobacillus bayanensis TaxID=2485998 RepID=UPI000F78C635|nr:TetR/AcrR family transcriptional regulator [Lapidilactobacillus bayanensis]